MAIDYSVDAEAGDSNATWRNSTGSYDYDDSDDAENSDDDLDDGAELDGVDDSDAESGDEGHP